MMPDGVFNKTRRKLLQIVGYSLILVSPSVRSSNRDFQAPSSLAVSLRALGSEYLRRHPDEQSRQLLLNALHTDKTILSTNTCLPPPNDLGALINSDFGNDKLVYLNGWALSQTEARLAALSIV